MRSSLTTYLSARMLLGVMVILLAYTLLGLPLAHNAVLSILGGTVVHIALARV